MSEKQKRNSTPEDEKNLVAVEASQEICPVCWGNLEPAGGDVVCCYACNLGFNLIQLPDGSISLIPLERTGSHKT